MPRNESVMPVPQKGPVLDDTTKWNLAASKLLRFAQTHSDHHGGFVPEADYVKMFGCPEDCDIQLVPGTPHKHVKGEDRSAALLVTYTGAWEVVTHRRGRPTRTVPVYLFARSGSPVRITFPADKYAYIRRHLANPEEWKVAWDGEA